MDRLHSPNSSDIFLLIFGIGAFLNFLPFFLGGYSMKDPVTKLYPDYMNRLSSFEYTASLVASLATTIPILVDYLFDRFLKIVQHDENLSNEDTPSIYIPLRETIVVLFVPDILMLCWIVPFGLYDYLVILLNARDTIFTYSLFRCLLKFENSVWTPWSLVFICGPLMVNNVLMSFSILTTNATFIANTGTASYILMSIGLFSFSVNVIWWFWHFFHLNEKDITIASYLCSAYVVLVVIFLLGNWVPLLVPSHPGDPWSLVGVSYLTCYSYLMASCTICLTVTSTRCASIDATRVRIVFEKIWNLLLITL
jgi:hypothetical protein